LLAFVQYSQLTAAIINGDYRNFAPTADLSEILVNVVDAKGAPVEKANVKIWSVVGDTSHQSQLMVDTFTGENGQIGFAWGGSTMPHNTYDFLRLIKVYKEGYASSAKYVSIFDVDRAKLVYEKDRFMLTIALHPVDSLQAPVSTFADVPVSEGAWKSIEAIYSAGITGGCSSSPLIYCPSTQVTRAQMAVFLERGIHGSSYSPPAAGNSTGFADIAPDYWAAAWIKQLVAEGITSGCGANSYCPEAPVTRGQMAVFLLRAKYGASYTPPGVGTTTGFSDVPANHWAAAWIKQLAAEGITSGCGAGSYCPETPITRAQLAVFMAKIFNLP
ncbi:MAG TPA: S-layer homology domain-containing protein, partial [Anaerolineales bacterium]